MIKNIRNLFIILLPVAVYAGDEYEKHKSELFIAAYTNDYQLMKSALDYKVDVNTICHDKFPSIHAAAKFCDPKCVKLLISAKADLRILDAANRTCLHWAIDSKYDEVLKILLDAGVDPHKKDRFEFLCPLGLALKKNNFNKAKKLLFWGVEPGIYCRGEIGIHSPSSYRFTIFQTINFWMYKTYDFNDIIQRRSEENNFRDNLGVTPILYASAKGNEIILKALLEYSKNGPLEFDSLSVDKVETPLQLAKEYGQENVVKLLLEYANKYSELLRDSSGLNLAISRLITEYALGDGYFYTNNAGASQ